MAHLLVSASGKPLSEIRITQFEQLIGKRLPDAYKTFLLRHNGGTPNKRVAKLGEGATVLSEFRSLGSGTIHRLEQSRGDRYPTDHLAIADDMFGNFILLSLAPATFGQVYWKDHEAHALDDPPQLLAKSFEQFLNGLTAEQREEIVDRLERLGKFGSEADLDAYLAQGGALENSTPETGIRLAQHAARYGNLPLLKALLRRGASPAGVLHSAVTNGHRDVIDYLLNELGADVHEKDHQGFTAVQCAYADPELERYLLSRHIR